MKKQVNTILTALKYCVQLSWKTSHFYTIVRLFSLILMVLLPFVPIYLTKFLIDSLTQTTAIHMSQLAALLLFLVLARICTQAFTQVNTYVQTLHNELMDNHINQSLVEKTSTMDLSFFDSPDYLDTLQAVMTDSLYLLNLIWNMFHAFSQLISLAIATVAVAQYHWLFAVVIIVAAFPSAVASRKYAAVLYRWRIDHMAEERKRYYIQSISSDKQYASDIRLFQLSTYLVNRFSELSQYCFHMRKKVQKKQLAALLFTAVLPELCLFFILLSIVRGVTLGHNTVGDLSLFIGMFASMLSALDNVVRSVASIYEDKLKAETVQGFFSRPNVVQDNGTEELSGNVQVVFENVSFRYPGSDQDVLRNISFAIDMNEKVCLIGTNGAGKSTIIKLLLRLYDVTGGRILINNRDIREYTLVSLRQSFSTFFQDYNTYAFTFQENITLSRLGEEDVPANLQRALELSGAQEIAAKLAHGYETFIHRIFDQDGYEPSGGEKQKISLARTIYRRCDMIVFDEPSSALDPIAETELFENMRRIWHDKSALFTSHRLAAVHMADKILMLEDGHIIESGTHEELISLENGKYKHLYTLQARKYASA